MNESEPKTEAPRGAPRSARGRNPGRSREHNRRVVLDLLRGHEQMGRRDLAERTQLSLQAVTNIVDGLIADGLLVARGRRRGSRGQPPLQYAIDPAGAITIGIELAVTQMVTAVVDLGGMLRSEEVEALDGNDPATLLPRIAAKVEAIRADRPGRLIGLGLVMPGPFEIEGFTGVGPTALPGWAGIDVAADLSARLGVPVEVGNDADAAAIGETLLGVGQALTDFCVIYFGTGIGLGIIADNAPVRGAFGNAGEIGHIVVAPGGRPCACGQSGCLERYASLHALRERLGARGLSSDFGALERMVSEGNTVLDDWIAEAAAHLSPMVAILENVLDPQTIVLSGGLPGAILDAIIARLAFAPSVSRRSDRSLDRVLRGHTGRITAARGAAALPLHSAITPRLDLADAPTFLPKGAPT